MKLWEMIKNWFKKKEDKAVVDQCPMPQCKAAKQEPDLYEPNPYGVVVVSLPPTMNAELAANFTLAFEHNLMKIGGFGGVARTNPATVSVPDMPINYYKTDQPYVVVREVTGKVFEKTLNAVIDGFLQGRVLNAITPEDSIQVLFYEFDAVTHEVVDAWYFPALFYARSLIDGRQDARAIYMDIFGDLRNRKEYVQVAQDYHNHKLACTELQTALTQVM